MIDEFNRNGTKNEAGTLVTATRPLTNERDAIVPGYGHLHPARKTSQASIELQKLGSSDKGTVTAKNTLELGASTERLLEFQETPEQQGVRPNGFQQKAVSCAPGFLRGVYRSDSNWVGCVSQMRQSKMREPMSHFYWNHVRQPKGHGKEGKGYEKEELWRASRELETEGATSFGHKETELVWFESERDSEAVLNKHNNRLRYCEPKDMEASP